MLDRWELLDRLIGGLIGGESSDGLIGVGGKWMDRWVVSGWMVVEADN